MGVMLSCCTHGGEIIDANNIKLLIMGGNAQWSWRPGRP